MPTFEELKSTINRKKKNLRPSESTIASQLIIDPKWINSLVEEELFLQIDDTFEGNRILVFYKESYVKSVLETIKDKIMFIDGTFKSSARMFKQSYTIHLTLENHGVPIIYCLLENKKESTYRTLFELLKKKLNFDSIETSMSDFEIATIYAIRSAFPRMKIKGCYFHYAQAIIKNLGKHGFKAKYNKNKQFQTLIRNLLDLVLVPKEEVFKLYQLISQNLKNLDENEHHKSAKFKRHTFFSNSIDN